MAQGTAPPARAVDVPTLLAAYNERRLEDAIAAVTLSERGMGGARSVRLPFLAKLYVTKLLNKTLGRLAPEVKQKGDNFRPPSSYFLRRGSGSQCPGRGEGRCSRSTSDSYRL